MLNKCIIIYFTLWLDCFTLFTFYHCGSAYIYPQYLFIFFFFSAFQLLLPSPLVSPPKKKKAKSGICANKTKQRVTLKRGQTNKQTRKGVNIKKAGPRRAYSHVHIFTNLQEREELFPFSYSSLYLPSSKVKHDAGVHFVIGYYPEMVLLKMTIP